MQEVNLECSNLNVDLKLKKQNNNKDKASFSSAGWYNKALFSRETHTHTH